MDIRKIQWSINAWNDYLYWQANDKTKVKRINQIIKDIPRNPFEGVGKPEPLRGNLSGFWSRRIDDEHRLIYMVKEDIVLIFACKGHYE